MQNASGTKGGSTTFLEENILENSFMVPYGLKV